MFIDFFFKQIFNDKRFYTLCFPSSLSLPGTVPALFFTDYCTILNDYTMAKKENKYTFLYIQHTAQKFLDRAMVGGLDLVIASIVTMIIANSKWGDAYFHFLENEFFFEFTDYFSFVLVIVIWIKEQL